MKISLEISRVMDEELFKIIQEKLEFVEAEIQDLLVYNSEYKDIYTTIKTETHTSISKIKDNLHPVLPRIEPKIKESSATDLPWV